MVLPRGPRRRKGIAAAGGGASKAPRASAFAKQRAELLHLGSLNWCAMPARPPPDGPYSLPPPRCCPGAVSLEETSAAVTPITRMKVVAASGIAPDSPRLHRGALIYLSYTANGPSEVEEGNREAGGRASSAVSRRGLSLFGRIALLLTYGGMKMVARQPSAEGGARQTARSAAREGE